MFSKISLTFDTACVCRAELKPLLALSHPISAIQTQINTTHRSKNKTDLVLSPISYTSPLME